MSEKVHMTVSASQIKTHLRCPRQRWFEKVLRLPQEDKQHFAFGTALHGVVERWLLADDQGRVNGEPVELYPEGWDEGLNLVEAGGIKKLVAMGIEEGVLERRPGRVIEEQFGYNYTTDKGEVFPVVELDDAVVEILGYIDVVLPDEVQDHKTSKSPRWFLGVKALAEDTQLLIYAKTRLERARKRGEVVPDEIRLRHNQFCKDPTNLLVKKTEATVSAAEVDQFWQDQIIPACAEMYEYSLIEKWEDVEGPREAGACNAYGGCPFRTICGGQETTAEYNKRVLQFNEKSLESRVKTTPKGDARMNIFKKQLAARKKAKAATNNTPAPAVNPKVAKPEPEAEVATATTDAPPWARPDCKACEGSGFNSKGSPCRICDNMQKKDGGPTSSDFIIDTDPEGNPIWEEKANVQQLSQEAETPEVPEETGEEAEPEQGQGVQSVEEESPVLRDAAVAESSAGGGTDVSAAILVHGEKKRGRPKAGFTLCIGCAPSRSNNIILLDDVMHRLGQNLGEKNFYALNVWDRRAAIASAAEGLVSEFGISYVVAISECPDMEAFVEALIPHATEVIRG